MRIPTDGHFGYVRTEGNRFALGAAASDDALIFQIGDLDDSPFDGSPLALVATTQVRELRDALSDWLDRPRRRRAHRPSPTRKRGPRVR